ncbi:hypothetical protein OH76DRAFT_1488007 [Lentinus brumalis]|uniref:Uncharacterized protein n=1 Tax=Lentinus brumalis TaxID=2498619 RepID=A0A371CSR4_9APHY|nr:hypothetical protein OH76DRAFT_1488007 [Polyporus brumalis]
MDMEAQMEQQRLQAEAEVTSDPAALTSNTASESSVTAAARGHSPRVHRSAIKLSAATEAAAPSKDKANSLVCSVTGRSSSLEASHHLEVPTSGPRSEHVLVALSYVLEDRWDQAEDEEMQAASALPTAYMLRLKMPVNALGWFVKSSLAGKVLDMPEGARKTCMTRGLVGCGLDESSLEF